MQSWIESRLERLAGELSPCRDCPVTKSGRLVSIPGQKAIVQTLEQFIGILFPGCHGGDLFSDDSAGNDGAHGDADGAMRARIASAAERLADQAARAFAYYDCLKAPCDDCGDCRKRAENAVGALLDALPSIRRTLEEDIQAAYEGDPAAKSTVEVVMSYPGLYAIAVHRVAHELQRTGVPLIPRVMSEHAHSKTGIDIHPGATIGPGFFIDHGTGVVIGETCTIGRHVKLYQGVTLGARSFAKNPDGTLVKGLKRHPDVEDDVVIYAGATVLGGETVIGRGSVIGASVWVTFSVPPGSKVLYQPRGEAAAQALPRV